MNYFQFRSISIASCANNANFTNLWENLLATNVDAFASVSQYHVQCLRKRLPQFASIILGVFQLFLSEGSLIERRKVPEADEVERYLPTVWCS